MSLSFIGSGFGHLQPHGYIRMVSDFGEYELCFQKTPNKIVNYYVLMPAEIRNYKLLPNLISHSKCNTQLLLSIDFNPNYLPLIDPN
jgi:hypothetical protein